jgi:serine/threonine protein kinase
MTPHIPGYELLEPILLREGWGSDVYKARHSGLGCLVAIKVYGAAAAGGEGARERIRRQCEVAARLSHPNIVRVLDYGACEDGRPYVATEFAGGGSLADRLRKDGPLPPREAAGLFTALADATHSAHQYGVLHTDLNPNRVLFADSGAPRVTGFGMARLVDWDTCHVDTVGRTPAYMAPEYVTGQTEELGPTTDVWALGAMLYEALSGATPFQASSASEIFRRVLFRPPGPLHSLRPGVPPDLETVCLKCLEKKPVRRYASAAALAEDLGRFLADRPVTARRGPFWKGVIPWWR